VKAVGKEARDEQRVIADVPQFMSLAHPRGSERFHEAHAKRFVVVGSGRIGVNEPGEKVHQIERGDLARG
jgi:hypothetical protein